MQGCPLLCSTGTSFLHPLPGGLSQSSKNQGAHTETTQSPTTAASSWFLGVLQATSRLPGSQQHFQAPRHCDIRGALSQAAGAGGRWAGT